MVGGGWLYLRVDVFGRKYLAWQAHRQEQQRGGAETG